MRNFSIVLTLALASSASAQSISAHPTLWVGTDDLGHAQHVAVLNLGVDARTPVAAGFSAEAFISANLSDSTAKNGTSSVALQDNSSFVRLAWTPTTWAENEGLALTLMPFHADRIFFGYEFPLVYDLKTPVSMSSENGAVVRIARARAFGALSVRSSVGLDVQDREQHRHYAAMASAGCDLLDLLRVEAQVGHQDLGINPVPQVLGAAVSAVAAAARVTFHHGTPIGPLVDVDRYRSDPAFWETVLAPPSLSDGLAYGISLEGLGVSTSGLADPDEFGRTARMTAEGGALQARARWRGTRAELRLQMRSLTLLEQPNLGFPRYYPLPRGIDTQSEYSGSLSADHTFVATHLTVGAGMDVVSPAAFSTVATEGGSPVPTRLVVVASANSFDVLPTGVGSSAWWRARLYGRWDVDHFSAVAEAFLRDDPNLTKFADNFQGVSEPVFAPSTNVGFNLVLQARFP